MSNFIVGSTAVLTIFSMQNYRKDSQKKNYEQQTWENLIPKTSARYNVNKCTSLNFDYNLQFQRVQLKLR